MTDYRQKYENERTARKQAEKEVELLKKEIELLKMELKQSNRSRSPQISKETSESESEKLSSSESEDDEPVKNVIRRKKPAKLMSHEIELKPLKNTLNEIINDAVEKMSMGDYASYGSNMEISTAYELNLFESILKNLKEKDIPIVVMPDGRFNVFDTVKGEKKWEICDLNRLVDKTYGRIHNSILKHFNNKKQMRDITQQSEIDQIDLLSTLHMLCKIEPEKLLKARSRSLAKMFKK